MTFIQVYLLTCVFLHFDINEGFLEKNEEIFKNLNREMLLFTMFVKSFKIYLGKNVIRNIVSSWFKVAVAN